MSERSDAAEPDASRGDRETLLKIARQINSGVPEVHRNGAGGDGEQNGAPGEAKAGDGGAERSFEGAAAGLALCANGEITRANPSFALAFGYPTADALLAAGGLAAIFPRDAAMLTKPSRTNGGGEKAVIDAVTRSRRRVKMPVAMHEITGEDGDKVMLLVLHPDAAPVNIGAIKLPAKRTSPAAAAETQSRESETQAVIVKAIEPGTPVAVRGGAPPEDIAEKAPGKTKRRRGGGETEFLARISHDMRTPLNSIIGFAQLMKEEQLGPLGSDRYRGYVRDIMESGEFALGLINDLLDISKVENGAYELNFTSVDLNELAGECIQETQPNAQKARVFLRMALGGGLPLVLADRPSLKQILLTLLRNAVTFTNPGGQVVLESCLKPSGAVRIRVQDSGAGMSESEIAQAMQPFRRRDTAPRLHYGMGLALPLTKALAKANRAKFRLVSSAATGTKVSVTFPPGRTLGH